MALPPPPFSAPYAPDDEGIAKTLIEGAALPPEREAAIDALALDLVAAIRTRSGLGAIETMLREYDLSSREGLALMVLAEALLRVPDAATADRLIADRLGEADFAHHTTRGSGRLTQATVWALGLGARIVAPGETPDAILAGLVRRLGKPAVRAAAHAALGLMGGQFVLGEDIGAALRRAGRRDGRRYRYSFDMLGEGARTAADAAAYRNAYAEAIAAIGRTAEPAPLPERPGISIKLSALHPRYGATQAKRVMAELVPVLCDLARSAKAHDLALTVDAEEAERLELSLDVIGAVLADPALADWDGFGLAVQAYGKRCLAVIDHVAALAWAHDRRLTVRLVKGAYWDTEVKLAQVQGLSDYPVFTRKAMTDLAYLAAARRLLGHRPRLHPQFATHNALTIATLATEAGDMGGYEFQRLHGMGEALYGRLLERHPGLACRVYAPVGDHRHLLAYLVRRLIENGASSSFVARAADPMVPAVSLIVRPQALIETPSRARHPGIPRPGDLFGPDRRNSPGIAFGHRIDLDALIAEVAAAPAATDAVPDGDPDAAMAAAARAQPAWARRSVDERAACLERAADALVAGRGRFVGLLQAEGGKTLDDALAEWREAIDLLRYYAIEARRLLGRETPLPGPAGESNVLSLRARGVMAAISPWNFPLAICLGQVAAALVTGNAAVAKPAPQTPRIARDAVSLLHAAGVPAEVLHLVAGGPAIGARLVAHPALAGVVFTGSTATAQTINRALAAREGAILPLVAETGGLNAMIVDATALPEQVADDVAVSAFRSSGQRCSALRLLFLQEEVADGMIAMIFGAAAQLRLGDPRDPATDLGPVIDVAAKARIDAHIAAMKDRATVHVASQAPAGSFVAPTLIELARAEDLSEEVFGPVLHVVRYAASDLDAVVARIAASGHGLTLGIHSRIAATVEYIAKNLGHGNVYVNRSMIGAVVGSQPFGGTGLSGTGPKAGGPHYLARFVTERTLSVNTAAVGGSIGLVTLDE